MTVPFTPSPVPQDDNAPLRVYLDREFRSVANAQEEQALLGNAILFRDTDNVVANDATETAIVNYTDSFNDSILETDPVLGTITVPNKAGLLAMTAWVSMEQITSTRNFTAQLKLEVNGVWANPIIGAAYLPQQGSDVHVAIAASLTRIAAGGEVFRLGLILDGASSATFDIVNTSFEVRYSTFRG